MTTLLHERVQEYLRLRRALGFRLEYDGHRLSQFAGYLQRQGATVLTAEHAIAWAQLPRGVTPWTWTQRLTAVRGFATWLRTIDPATEIPPGRVFPGYGKRPAPFIFTDDDIAAMHAACGSLRPWFRSATYTALFGLVAVTGIRIGEALAIPVGGIDLLQALPGYKGPDIFSRGVKPEDDAFFFLDELETIIREWVATVYHCRPHADLVDPGLPKLRMSPAAMFQHGMERAGYIEVPRDPHLGYEFLATRWRTIQHYGVEIDSRRYSGQVLKEYGGKISPYRRAGKRAGKNEWPFQVDPDDITRIYFRDNEGHWHTLTWEHAPSLEMPLSEDALAFARKLAASRYRYPDDRIAVADLLERWKVGLAATPAERRIMLRMAREQNAFDIPEGDSVTSLPSVQKVLEGIRSSADDGAVEDAGPPDEVPEAGDDDAEDEETLEGEESALVDDDDFYADALGDV
jgi:hypothetical protein